MTQTGFVLRRLQVFNWGPFHGMHDAAMDARGTAIIGPTGSGKTTLVDALMTLLVAQPRYNLASTGGHESDRDLMSYLRGVSGPGAGAEGDGTDAHVGRPGATTTGIAATLVREGDAGEAVQLVGLFWTDGPGFAASDRSDYWLVVRHPQAPELSHWLSLLHEDGVRLLKKEARAAEGVQPFDTKKAYLAQLRRFFEVGDNAFTLLNRAAGLKQLNSIDDIFRELVLDDRAKHGQATDVVREFDTLVGIHQELQRAVEQQQALLPVARLEVQHRQKEAQVEQVQRLQQALPGWFAVAGVRLWQLEAQTHADARAALEDEKAECQRQIATAEADAERLRQRYVEAGGGNLEDKQALLLERQARLSQVSGNAKDYLRAAASLQLSVSLSPQAVASNRQVLASSQARAVELEQELRDRAYKAGGKRVETQQQWDDAKAEIQKVRQRPGSNIPPGYQDFRAELAAALQVEPQAIPFVAELAEVKAQERNWRGAIERALGGERLRLLVAPQHVEDALQWVNGRHNRLHVRLLDTRAIVQRRDRRTETFADGFVRKLNLREHALRPALEALLAQHDRHCVPSPEVLRQTDHAMTTEGLLSGQQGRFDKQDQRALGEGWLTGFDNRDQLQALEKQAADAQTRWEAADRDYTRAKQDHEVHSHLLKLREQLMNVEFSDIDSAGLQAQVTGLAEQIAALQKPGSELAVLQVRIDEVALVLSRLRDKVSGIDQQIGSVKTKYTEAQHQLARAQAEEPAGGIGAFAPEIAQHLPPLDQAQAGALAPLLKEAQVRQQQALLGLSNSLTALVQQLVRAMAAAKSVDTGELAETGTELRDIPAYLERLRVLEHEALPEKRERFQLYLNQSSDQGVSQLLSDIDNEVSVIEERIEDLNTTLARVAFQPGRHLRLVTRKVMHQSLRDLQAAQRQLRTAALRTEEPEGHFRALQQVVQQLRQASDNRRTQAARALLDPRWRLEFAVSLVETATGRVVETRTGSQGGSGGEKEIIASYILTASLSYALAPDGQAQPRFATVVLDEAFSRTSQAVAARIVAALRAFGLHPLFVTPNKEMRLLREHTRSAILVLRKGQRSQLASLRWEELDTHALALARATALAQGPP